VTATRLRAAALLLALALCAPAQGGYSFESPPSHPDWEPGVEALQRLDWDAAIAHLSQVVTNEPDNADAHNALGFAYRERGRRIEAFRHLREALRLKPDHLSARENLGGAYLRAGDRARAREQLAALERLCARRCDEYRNLAKSIAAAK